MSPYAKYQQNQTLTADPGTLILMLYDGAVAALKKCKGMLEAPSYRRDEFSKQIVKAQSIIMELMASLNFEAGGEIARNLWRLYEYMTWQLRRADLNKDPQLIEDVLRHLISLRGAWRQILDQQHATVTFSMDQSQPSHARSFMVA